MNKFKLSLSILRFIIYLIASWLFILLTWLLSPILAMSCFMVKEDPHKRTNYPSEHFKPSGPRAFLLKQIWWFQTHDNPLDEWWYGNYVEDSWLKTTFSQTDYITKWYVNYKARLNWLCRNPAYGFQFFLLGYDFNNVKYIVKKDEDIKWKTGVNNTSYWITSNENDQYGFQFKTQWYFYKQHCLEIILGWDFTKDEYIPKRMLKFRFSPFRKYELKT